jgi:hypothetical protein
MGPNVKLTLLVIEILTWEFLQLSSQSLGLIIQPNQLEFLLLF